MSERRSFWRKLVHRYRLVIMDEDAYQEKFTIRLSRINVFVFVGFGILSLIALTTLLIAFTPLREYIPGYGTEALVQRAKLEALTRESDSIERVMKAQQLYLRHVEDILKGRVSGKPVDSLRHLDSILRLPDSAFLPTEKASAFRSKVEQQMRYDLTKAPERSRNLVLFSPVRGLVSDGFDIEKKHFGVDIACRMNEAVKAAAAGTIIFAGWTAHTGNTIVLQSAQDLITVYKHNNTLYKREGERVKAGTVIAAAGNSGEFSSGPHLHFEIWISGHPVDPLRYIKL